jgi:gliding motility-associated-like protein
LCTGNTLKLEVDSIAGGNYIWSRSNGQQFTGSRLVIENVWLTDSGTYSIDLNVNGCSVPPKEIRVTVNDHTFYFPTAFTPNGDGLNEVFKPATFYEGPYDIRIYDRWGQLVFQSNDPKEAWDGSVFGGPGDAGAYNYIVSYEGCVRDKEFLNGVVYLIK